MAQSNDAFDTGHPNTELLIDYQAGELDTERADTVAAHLNSCDRCRAEAEQFGNMAQMLSALPQYRPERSFVLDELYARRQKRHIWPAYTSLAASIVLAVGMLGVLASNGNLNNGSETSAGSAQTSSMSGGAASGSMAGATPRVAYQQKNASATAEKQPPVSGMPNSAVSNSSAEQEATAAHASGGVASRAVPVSGESPRGKSFAGQKAAARETTAILSPKAAFVGYSPTVTLAALAGWGNTQKSAAPSTDRFTEATSERSSQQGSGALPWILGAASAICFALFVFLLVRYRRYA